MAATEREEMASEIFEGEGPIQYEPAEPEQQGQPEKEEARAEEVVAPQAPTFDPSLLVTRLDEMSNRLKTAEGRVGALQSELAKRAAAETVQAPTEKQVAKAKSDADFEELKEIYPEWAASLESEANERKSGQSSLEQRIAGFEQKMSERVEHGVIASRYPDWEETVNTPQFAGWFKSLPMEDQQVFRSSPHGRDVVRLLDHYGKAQAPAPQSNVKQDRKARLQQAESVRSSPAQFSKSESDMSPAELRQMLSKQIW